MRKKYFYFMLLLLLFQVNAKAQFATDDCTLTHPKSPTIINAFCGVLDVPLDHDQDTGSHLALHFAVIPARDKRSQAAPLFFFAGGPGQSAMGAAAILPRLKKTVGRRQDIVFIDQRGTGQSSPFNCPFDDALDNLRADDARMLQETKKCLQSATLDPAYFTSYQAVHDVEQVRLALGYKQIDLLGVSYGTRIAQLYLKAYPQGVRSIVLDGVVPLTSALGSEFSANLHRTLDLVIAQCAADASCGRAFPQLQQEWQQYLAIDPRAAQQIHLSHPLTGEELTLEVDREVMDSALRMLSYSSTTQVMIPLLIHISVAGNWQPLISQAIQVAVDLQADISMGMHNSVACSEDAPFLSTQTMPSNRLLSRLEQQMRLNCEQWKKGRVFAEQHAKPEFKVPALLLSGELDPATPPEYADRAAGYFSSAQHIVLKGQGHNVLEQGCIPKLVGRFLKDLVLSDEQMECANNTAKLPFFIDLMGPGA